MHAACSRAAVIQARRCSPNRQVRSILRHGFTRVVLLNGHGGNETALKNISQELSQVSHHCRCTVMRCTPATPLGV